MNYNERMTEFFQALHCDKCPFREECDNTPVTEDDNDCWVFISKLLKTVKESG